MSIDYLTDLERAIENGRDVFACPGIGRNQYVISKTVEDLKKIAKRVADTQKTPASIVRLVPR